MAKRRLPVSAYDAKHTSLATQATRVKFVAVKEVTNERPLLDCLHSKSQSPLERIETGSPTLLHSFKYRRINIRSLEEGGTHSKSLVDLLRAEVTLDKAQLTDSYDIGRIYAAPCPKIHALPEERITQLGASAFPFGEWNILSVSISPIIRAACGRIQIQSRGRRTDQRRSEPQQVWRPAPSELAISIFWNMLQASAPPPSHVCTNLSHHYTRLIKA
ncbi:hypothetical protein V8E36_002866 [Tilletia maclaganii]